jgi:hypothetical protein
MKYNFSFLIIGLSLLIVTFIFVAGCTGTKNIPPSTPIPTQTATALSSDPIVGDWQWTKANDARTYKFTFFYDGSFYSIYPYVTSPSGSWSKIRTNEYKVTYSDGTNLTFVYNPVTDTFSMPEYSQVLAYRWGKDPSQTFLPTPTITYQSASSGYSGSSSSGSSSSGNCWVNGYYRKSGTWVNGYYRSC